ncbi:MAG: hypothetical protein PUF12_06025 [Thermoflexaceae bacterium]|nr:hypothetical protein [Thermoflexaceae bacterium]
MNSKICSRIRLFFQKKLERNLLYLIPTILWMIAVTVLNYFCSSHVINSDMSAEMVVANELAKTNKLFTTQWFYSTEIYFIHMQTACAFWFKFFHSWSVVRTLANLTFLTGLLFSYLYAMKPLKLSKKSVYLSSLFLFIPYSMEYLYIVHTGTSYTPHFIVLFLAMGLILRLFSQRSRRNLILYILVSFYAGICGIRFMTIFAIPVVLAFLLKIVIENQESGISLFRADTYKKPAVYIPLLGFVICLAGVLVNSQILTKFISVGSTNDLLMNQFNGMGILGKLDTLIIDILRLFGYYDFTTLTTLSGFASIAAVVILVALVMIVIVLLRNYKSFSDSCRYCIVLFLMSFFTNTFIFVFIAGTYVPRFYMPSLVLLAPCIAMFLNEKKLMSHDFNKLVAILLMIAMNISGISLCYTWAKVDLNAPFKEVVNYLEENDLTFGLTTFWNTGVVNELSDGRVECVNIRDEDITQINPWLTFKKYLRSENWKNVSSDSIFILLDGGQYENFAEHPMIQAGTQVYDQNGYVIVVYDKEYFISAFGNQYFVD